MRNARPGRNLLRIYQALYRHFGPQQWWPGETPFEVIVGAILTQNTNWTNVEKAIDNLKAERLITPVALKKASMATISQAIKPSGYFNIKAKRLKNFIDFFFAEYRGKMAWMDREETPLLRKKLLSVNGIGPETADSILLYALHRRSFVIDAYTKRIFARHRFVPASIHYDDLKAFFESRFPRRTDMYNEFHALIVNLGKNYCKPKAKCGQCPLNFLNDHPETRYRV